MDEDQIDESSRTSQAAITAADLINTDETPNTLINRIKFYLTSNYPVSFKNVRSQGTGDERILIISFKHPATDQAEFDDLLSRNHINLKRNNDSSPPKFHVYDTK